MTKNQLRQLIREEIINSKQNRRTGRKSLNEAFGSSKLNNLYNKYKKEWNSFNKNNYISKLYKKYNIDWAKIPDDSVEIMDPLSALGKKNSLIIWVSTSTKESTRANKWNSTVHKGILGITHGRKIVDLGSGYKYKDKAVTHEGGLVNSKALSEYSDEAYCIDFDIITKYQNALMDLKEKRRQWQGGVFKTDKEFKAQNLARYKEIIKQKVLATTDVDKIFKELCDIVNSKITESYTKIRELENGKWNKFKVGEVETYGRINDVKVRDIIRYQQDAFDIMERYLDQEEQIKEMEEREQKVWNFYKEDLKRYQLELNNKLKEVKKIKFAI